MIKMLGIVHAFNEEDCVGNALSMLLKADHEVHAFDHGSTDRTAEVMQSLNGVKYHRLDRDLVPVMDSRRRPMANLWRHIAAFINDRASRFDWLTWMDADELLRDQAGAIITHRTIEAAAGEGVAVVSPRLRNFWMTDADPSSAAEPDYLRRLRYCETIRRPIKGCPRCWLPIITGTPERVTRGRHRKDNQWRLTEGQRIETRWTLDHYPMRTRDQGERKVLRDRPWGPPQYRRLRSAGLKGMVRRASGLQRVRYRELPAG